jgi:hypothetical protein
MIDAERVLRENLQLKSKVQELQTVIVNMCVLQNKTQESEVSGPRQVKLKATVDFAKSSIDS